MIKHISSEKRSVVSSVIVCILITAFLSIIAAVIIGVLSSNDNLPETYVKSASRVLLLLSVYIGCYVSIMNHNKSILTISISITSILLVQLFSAIIILDVNLKHAVMNTMIIILGALLAFGTKILFKGQRKNRRYR